MTDTDRRLTLQQQRDLVGYAAATHGDGAGRALADVLGITFGNCAKYARAHRQARQRPFIESINPPGALDSLDL